MYGTKGGMGTSSKCMDYEVQGVRPKGRRQTKENLE